MHQLVCIARRQGGVRRVRAVDTPRLKVFVSKKLFGGILPCVNKERSEGINGKEELMKRRINREMECSTVIHGS